MAEVAEHQAEAANVIARNADACRAKAGLDPRAEMALSKAARIQSFLDLFSELASGKHRFRTAEVNITETLAE